MATKLRMMLTYHEGLPTIISYDLSIMWSCEVTWLIKYVMSPLALDRWPPSGHLQLACLFSFLVLFLDRLTRFVCVFSYYCCFRCVLPGSDLLTCYVTYLMYLCIGGFKQEHVKSCSPTTKNILSPLSHCLWSPNLVEWWLVMSCSHLSSHLTLWSSGLEKSRNKLEIWYIIYHSVYEFLPINSHTLMSSYELFTSTVPMAKTLHRMSTYLEELLAKP